MKMVLASNGGDGASRRAKGMMSTATATIGVRTRILTHIIMMSLIMMVIVSLIPILKFHINTDWNNSNQLPGLSSSSTISSSSTSTSSTKSYIKESLSEFTKPRNPLQRIITAAGVSQSDIDHNNITDRLPKIYQAMIEQYGDMQTPIIHGMERCPTYQQNVPKEQRIVGVAGMFNTGTNAMEYHLRENLSMLKHVWQVPWGKHRVPYVRLHHIAPGMDNIQQEHVLPIIMIRDPFNWMQSMCRSEYAAHWKKTKVHCPNLVPTTHDIEKFHRDGIRTVNDTFNVTVKFDTNQILHWQSLIHLYNDWYQQYYTDATYPRLILRFEDMLLHAPTIVHMIGTCAGVDNVTLAMRPFKYQIQSAKGHGSHTDFFKAILKSGDTQTRIKNMTTEDIKFAMTHLDPELMKVMQYRMPEI